MKMVMAVRMMMVTFPFCFICVPYDLLKKGFCNKYGKTLALTLDARKLSAHVNNVLHSSYLLQFVFNSMWYYQSYTGCASKKVAS